MAITAAEILLAVRAKDEASGVLNKVSATAQSVGKNMGTALKVGGLAAAGGIGLATAAAVSFVKQAAAEEVGIERLRTAIGTLDKAHRGSADAVEDLIRERERLAFADDELRDSLSLLVVQTGDYEDAVRRQAIAMDVARGTGIDLQTASRLLGKINEETTNTFSRYGIVIEKGATETQALAEIQRRFAGQSQTFATTAAGKWEIFNNQLDNMKETIGAALLPLATQLGAALSEFLVEHEDDIERFSALFATKIQDAIGGIVDAFVTAQPTLTHIFNTLRTGFETIQPALEWIVNNKVAATVAIAAIGAALVLAFAPVSAPIAAVAAGIAGVVYGIGLAKQAFRDFTDESNKAAEDYKSTWSEQDREQHERVQRQNALDDGFWSRLKVRASDGWGFIRQGWDALSGHLQATWQQLSVSAGNWWGVIQTAGGAAATFIGQQWRDLVALFKGFGSDFEAVGRAIADDFWAIAGAVQAVIDKVQQLIDLIPSIPEPGDLLDDALGGAGNFLGGAISNLPGFASGTPFVPRDMLAVVHRGEAIIPAAQNRAGTYGNVAYITINSTGGQSDESAATIARQLAKILKDDLQMETLSGPRLPVGSFSPRRV